MLESYILTTDGKDYVDVDCVREALGIVDEHVDIFGVIKKLREERDKLKKRANATYGVSCGYSASKQPAFLCNVISYSWELAPIEARSLMDEPSYCVRNDSIRVELELTPTANYKGAFDLEDLKKYIQEYGREKKLGIVESVDYQNAKAARAELAHLYKQVLGKEKLDRDLSPHEVMKAILDEYERREDFIRELACSLGFGNPVVNPDNIDQKEKDILERIGELKEGNWPCENGVTFAAYMRKQFPKECEKWNVAPLQEGSVHDWVQYIFGVLDEWRNLANNNYNKAEGFRKEKRAVEDSLAELRAKIREIYRSVFCDCRWEDGYSYCSALNDINEEYKRVKDFFNEKNDELKEVKKEYSRYRLAVNSLLDIPKDIRDDINAIERAFTFSKREYKSLKEFRNDVCEILDIPSSMADNQEQILKEIHDFADRYYELRDFRADICGILDIEGMLGTPQQNDKYILEQVEKLKDIRVVVTHGCDHNSTSLDRYARFRSNVCTALCLGGETDDEDILNAITKMREEGNKLARLRSNICSEFSLVPENCDGNIIGHIHMMQDCHDKLCKDYTELRKAIWEAMDRKPETLPEETARLVGEVRMLQLNDAALKRMHTELRKAIGMDYPVTNNDIINRVKSLYNANESNLQVISDLNRQVTELKLDEKLLTEFRDAVAKAIGMDYPTTNQVILNNVQYIYKDRKDAYEIVAKLHDHVTELEKQVKGFTKRCDSLEDLQRDLWKLRRNAIEDLKSRGFCFRPEENETLPEIYDKLLKRYDWAYGGYKEQYRLRQAWHVRWESENERANGEHKRAEKLKNDVKCWTKRCDSLQTALNNSQNDGVALQSFRNECKKLREEKTKVISALGQDIWDDCLK